MANFWAPQLLYKLGSTRGKKVHFSEQLQEAPKNRATDWEEGFGRGDGFSLSSKNPEIPKTSSSGPTAGPGAEPIPARRFWLNGLELCSSECWSVTGKSARGRRPAGTSWGLQGPSSNPGLGILMNSKKKKKKSHRLKWGFMHFSIIAIFSARFLQHEDNAKHKATAVSISFSRTWCCLWTKKLEENNLLLISTLKA